MKSMDAKSTDMGKSAAGTTHHAKGTVKAVNPSGGTVTLANGAVKSLNWPAMTMGFRVKDKALFDKLTVGRKVAVSFVKEGANFVVTSVK
jgi:Cu(I)/Ag(I) efflux system protein CusF